MGQHIFREKIANISIMLTRNIRMDRKGSVDFYGILSEDNDGEKGAWVP